MIKTKQKHSGDTGEMLAQKFLTKNRFIILQQNFNCRYGEIDIIAQKKDTIHFIEVKTRSSAEDDPASFIHQAKQKRITNAAQWYVSQKKFDNYYFRFDVICIIMKKIPEITYYENAFTL